MSYEQDERSERYSAARRDAADPDPVRRSEAAIALGRLVGHEGATRSLLHLLHDSREDVRSLALCSLDGHGIPFDHFLSLLSHPEVNLRKLALRYVQPINRTDRITLASILPASMALMDPDASLRYEAALFLGRVSTDLLQSHSEIGIRSVAQSTQEWQSDSLPSKMRAVLFYSDPLASLEQCFSNEAVTHEDARIRLAWILALHRHGKITKACLESFLLDPDATVRAFSIDLLTVLEDGVDQRWVEQGLSDSHFLVRRKAVYALRKLENVSDSLLARSRALLYDPEFVVRLSVCKTFWDLKTNANVVTTDIIDRLTDEYYQVRFQAIRLVPWIQPASEEAALRLVEILSKGEAPSLFWWLGNSLHGILPHLPDLTKVSSAVQALLKHSNSEVREIAGEIVDHIETLSQESASEE